MQRTPVDRSQKLIIASDCTPLLTCAGGRDCRRRPAVLCVYVYLLSVFAAALSLLTNYSVFCLAPFVMNPAFALEQLPNRNSLPYMDLYGIKTARTTSAVTLCSVVPKC